MIDDSSLVAVKHIEKVGKQKEQIYYAISNGGAFTVWQANVGEGGQVEGGSAKVLEVAEAHNTQGINLMQFVSIKGEACLVTGAGLDQRLNIWRF